MELLSVTVKHFHPPVMLPAFFLKSHLNSIIPYVTVFSVNIAQVFPDHNFERILCLPPPNAYLIICVNIINVYSPVCMNVNWTPGDMSVCLFQLANCRTGFDEMCLRVSCEVLLVVTEEFWYMILCNLIKIYWHFYLEDGCSKFFWNVSKCPQW